MSNYREDRSQSSPFQNGTDQQDRRSSQGDSAPHTPHNELVTRFRSFIAQQQETNRQHRLPADPAHIILHNLDFQTTQAHADQETAWKAHQFWSSLKLAWQVVAFERFAPADRESANHELWNRYRGGYIKPEVSLTRYQASILDAMSDAAQIRHTHGQTTIPVRQHMRRVSNAHEQLYDGMMHQFLSRVSRRRKE